VEDVAHASSLLANDPIIVDAVQKSGLSTLNSRAVVVRDRFSLALIQIFDRHRQACTNLERTGVSR